MTLFSHNGANGQ